MNKVNFKAIFMSTIKTEKQHLNYIISLIEENNTQRTLKNNVCEKI